MLHRHKFKERVRRRRHTGLRCSNASRKNSGHEILRISPQPTNRNGGALVVLFCDIFLVDLSG
jgi:hypothetical protein